MIRHIVLWRLRSADQFETIRVDVALLCDFESREALAACHRHPAQLETRAVYEL